MSLLNFTPLSNVDYSGGIIITEWFNDKNSKNERVHLYNLVNDPLEENNCAVTNKAKVSEMEELLQKLLDSQKKIDHNEDQLTSNEIENELRKMGYV